MSQSHARRVVERVVSESNGGIAYCQQVLSLDGLSEETRVAYEQRLAAHRLNLSQAQTRLDAYEAL